MKSTIRTEVYQSMQIIAYGEEGSLKCLRDIFEQRKASAKIWIETDSLEERKLAAEMVNYCNQQIKISLGIIDL
jgi:hypothetical protein